VFDGAGVEVYVDGGLIVVGMVDGSGGIVLEGACVAGTGTGDVFTDAGAGL